jgi:hypothetical protein
LTIASSDQRRAVDTATRRRMCFIMTRLRDVECTVPRPTPTCNVYHSRTTRIPASTSALCYLITECFFSDLVWILNGGAIQHRDSGDLLIRDCTFQTVTGGTGGAICQNVDADIEVSRCRGGYGLAIAVTAGTLTRSFSDSDFWLCSGASNSVGTIAYTVESEPTFIFARLNFTECCKYTAECRTDGSTESCVLEFHRQFCCACDLVLQVRLLR